MEEATYKARAIHKYKFHMLEKAQHGKYRSFLAGDFSCNHIMLHQCREQVIIIIYNPASTTHEDAVTDKSRYEEKCVKHLDVRANYDASHFDRRFMNTIPETVYGHLHNLQVQAEVARLDTGERLERLIGIQLELLETQKAILKVLQEPRLE